MLNAMRCMQAGTCISLFSQPSVRLVELSSREGGRAQNLEISEDRNCSFQLLGSSPLQKRPLDISQSLSAGALRVMASRKWLHAALGTSCRRLCSVRYFSSAASVSSSSTEANVSSATTQSSSADSIEGSLSSDPKASKNFPLPL